MKIATGIDLGVDIDSLSEDEFNAFSEQIRAAGKASRFAIARDYLSQAQCERDPHPVSFFMAGAPGAGKTEVSKGIVSLFPRGDVVRLDPDDFREYFDCYNGKNSHIVQRAISPIVDKCIDLSIENGFNLLLDGTLSKWAIAAKNIERAMKNGRSVVVMFVYQDPFVSWEFVKAREAAEGRRILKSTFVDQYFGSIDVMNQIIANFSPRAITWCTVKNAMSGESSQFLLKSAECLARVINVQYTRETLISSLQ